MISERVSVGTVLSELAFDPRAADDGQRCFIAVEARRAYPFLENELGGAVGRYCP